ncbi:MAG: META domain-containing protein [Brevundimonas sp.]
MRIVMAALLLAACSPAPAPSGPARAVAASPAPQTAADLRGDWRLVEMNGRRPADAGGDAVVPITMTVGDFSVRAQSQCIAIWRRYEWRENRLTLTPLNPGAMCARGLSDWETEFGRTLSGVTTAARADGRLRLEGAAGTLAFEPAPAAPRERFTGRWRLRFLHGAAPPEGERPLKITVTEDRITADACVFAGWRYRQDGRLLETTPLEAPVCERTLTPLERRFSAFMDGLNRATVIDSGALILDSAAEQLEFRRVE